MKTPQEGYPGDMVQQNEIEHQVDSYAGSQTNNPVRTLAWVICPFCRASIPEHATKCMYCCSKIPTRDWYWYLMEGLKLIFYIFCLSVLAYCAFH